MAFSEIFSALRKKEGLSQSEMAQRLFVTRQAGSRWGCGETTPNLETMQRISKEFRISINTLLGSPQALVCQSCGMPLADDCFIGTDADGALNEKYCKWCFADGQFTYECTMEEMIESCVPHMLGNGWENEADCRAFMARILPTLERWKPASAPAETGK